MNGDKRCTFEGMSKCNKYVIQVVNGDKRTIMTACNSINEARDWIKLKYHGVKKTIPLPHEIAAMNAVEKYVCFFKRTAFEATKLYILITLQKV